MPRKIYLPPEWTDEQIADFAAKWNEQPGHSQAKFERRPKLSAEMEAFNAELAKLNFT